MASSYRHLTGDASGTKEYKIVTSPRNRRASSVQLNVFLLSNTCATEVTIDIYLKSKKYRITSKDVDGKPMNSVDHSEIYYILKNIIVPSGASYNVLDGIGSLEYARYFDLHMKITGDAAKTLDLILNYE